jgi:molybdenum cofactor cytidylyltransferase
MKLSKALQINHHKVVATIGGGGKTSTLLVLAKELEEKQKKTIITTTTKMAAGEVANFQVVLGLGFQEIVRKIKLFMPGSKPIVLGTKIESGKLIGIPPEWVDKLNQRYPDMYILVEGDGAARKAFKAPGRFEPIIPSSTRLVIGLIGVEIIGKKLCAENVHRSELIPGLTKINIGDSLDHKAISDVIINKGGYRKNIPACSEFVVIINKVESALDFQKGEELASILLEKGVSRVVLAALLSDKPVREVFSA